LPGHFKDYIALPKNNGYKSLHSVVYHPLAGIPIEVQIRTPQMAQAAEWGVFEPTIGWLQNIEAADPVAFMDNVKKELFRDEIYIFDDAGSCYVLPRNATLADWLRRTHQTGLTHVESRGHKVKPEDKLRNGMILQVV
jgi:(p)ppGpp synthase/HD superfamily hydrolase